MKNLAINVKEKLPKFNFTKKLPNKWKGKLPKKVIIIALAVILLLVIFLIFRGISGSRRQMAAVNADVPVTRQNITSSITGTAVVMPKDQYSVTSLVTGEVLSADFEEGDYVNEGDVLYSIDATDIQKDIESAELAVEKARQSYSDAINSKTKTSETNQKNLESSELSVEKAQQSYESAQKTVDNLIIKSEISGTVAEVYVSDGDNVSTGMNIARVYDDSSLEIKIPFNEDDAAKISIGEAAQVTVVGSGGVLPGVVTGVDTASEVKNGYMKVRNVTIKVDSPGALSPADKATANVGDIYCNDAGTFKYYNEYTVTAKASGTVKSVDIPAGNYAAAGDTIVTLESDSAETQLKSASISLKEAEIAYSKAQDNLDDYSQDSQIKNAKISLDDALIKLEKTKEAVDDYKITAPISGQIITKNTKTGDKIDATNRTEAMVIIYDMSSLEFELMIDELDIYQVSVGQEVKVTADALDGKEYTGYVSNISINGTQASGVTSYPVSVVISEFDDALLPGMNIDAEITVSKAENVLAVPKNAVTRDNIVYVVGDKENPNDTAPEGYKSVNVEVGLNDENYIEIVSGLSEGDIVKSNAAVTASANNQMLPGMGMPGGGMGGGMPGSGRMPSGGMSGGMSGGGGMQE